MLVDLWLGRRPKFVGDLRRGGPMFAAIQSWSFHRLYKAVIIMSHSSHIERLNPKVQDPHYQEIPPNEVKHTKAGARGVQAGGNAGAMGDPASDQSQHNYQVSRDTDMADHARAAAEIEAARRREEIDDARANKLHNV
jgi:hypothetical protein